MPINFNKTFEKRGAVCFLIIIFFFFVAILRLATICSKDYREVQAKQSAYRLSVGAARGTVFDCNMVPITNSDKKIIAAVSPTPRAITCISSILSGDYLADTLDALKSGKPVLCEVPRIVECDGIEYVTSYTHNNSDTPAIHLIGYTNSDNIGVCGIEKAYNDYLYSGDNLDFVYSSDGLGNILSGVKPYVENSGFAMSNGVITTLDINIQNITEKAADNLERGAVIVCDSKSGEIKAMVSRPDFDCTNITAYLNREDSPMLNRALCAYSVGSVFKPCVAAAGIKKGHSSLVHNCTGSIMIGDRDFKCHKHSGHGVTNLTNAIAFSCNTYFYSLGLSLGGDAIYNMASSLQFGSQIELANGILAAKGNLPDKSALINSGNLANFSIGQGGLLLSPVALLNLYNAIANGGEYSSPSIVKSTLKSGIKNDIQKISTTRVFDSDTAEILKKALCEVLNSGTAADEKPTLTTAAGKTSTAQTGKYEGEREINRSWFCGFFPAENPRYTVIVLSEDSASGNASCAQIFSQIADDVTVLFGTTVS